MQNISSTSCRVCHRITRRSPWAHITGWRMFTLRNLQEDTGKGKLSSRTGRGVTLPSIAQFRPPPEDLPEGLFERPTPLLFVAGECQSADCWDATASFFVQRGCTVGTMALTGKGITPTDKLTLKALQAGVVAAVERSGLTPPVIVAHSIAGFVCQQYLQSYPASGLVLLDPFPPEPAMLATEYVTMALKVEHRKNPSAAAADVITPQGLAELIKDDPGNWEGMFWRFFSESRGDSRWLAPLLQDRVLPLEDTPTRARFPTKALGEMSVGKPAARLRLERHVVDTLVLGSDHVFHDESTEIARRKGLDATAILHGSKGWKSVDSKGAVETSCGVRKPWQELVWDWYNEHY